MALGVIVTLLFVLSAIFYLYVGRQASEIMTTEQSLQKATGAKLLAVVAQDPGNVVTISSSNLAKPGFIVIETVRGSASGVIGKSPLLPSGIHTNIIINLSERIVGEKLMASLWIDNGDGVFSPESDSWVTDEQYNLRVFQFFDVRTR